MSTTTSGPGQDAAPATEISARGSYARSVGVVLQMELRQRLRSRGWYIMLGIWFFIIGLVTLLTWASWHASMSGDFGYVSGTAGPTVFEIVLAFVLLFGLLVAPALSANAVNGDRASGTLAVLQVTLLTPWQIVLGKFLASWIASMAFLVSSVPFLLVGVLMGGLGSGHILVALVMLAVELGVVCGIGVGISALAGRPLFSIVVTYLAVAALVVGTLIAFAFGTSLSQGTVKANMPQYSTGEYTPAADAALYTCSGPLENQPAALTNRVAWVLGMNPYVVVADAIPYPNPTAANPYGGGQGILESISQFARGAAAGPEATTPCANGKVQPDYLEQTTPLWPLGLGLQLVVAVGLMWLGRQALRTPTRSLARGTRVA